MEARRDAPSFGWRLMASIDAGLARCLLVYTLFSEHWAVATRPAAQGGVVFSVPVMLDRLRSHMGMRMLLHLCLNGASMHCAVMSSLHNRLHAGAMT